MSPAARGEVLKLARLLKQPPESLAYLGAVPAADLAALREQVTDVLFDGDRSALGRVAEAGRIVPIGFMATVGQKIFGPVLCARLTGVLEPERALAVGLKMPPAFLARIAAEMDPRRAVAVITGVPPETTRQVAAAMAAADEHVAMGRFVAHLSDEALRACIAVIGEDDLLRTAFVLEGKERIDRLVELLPDARVRALVEAAVREELFEEALDLLAHLGDAQLERMGRLLAGRDPAPYSGLARVAAQHGFGHVIDRARARGVAIPNAV